MYNPGKPGDVDQPDACIILAVNKAAMQSQCCFSFHSLDNISINITRDRARIKFMLVNFHSQLQHSLPTSTASNNTNTSVLASKLSQSCLDLVEPLICFNSSASRLRVRFLLVLPLASGSQIYYGMISSCMLTDRSMSVN